MNTSSKDNEIMSLINVNEISRLICNTDKGTLTLKIRKGTSTYFFLLDSVELSKEINKELFELLYPKKETYKVNDIDNHTEIKDVITKSKKKYNYKKK